MTEVKTKSQMDHKPFGGVSVHRSRSQMPMVKAMTITVDNLLLRSKLDCDVSYDAAVKDVSVVVDATGTTLTSRRSSKRSWLISMADSTLRRASDGGKLGIVDVAEPLMSEKPSEPISEPRLLV